ncbi:GAF domain-containing protein [Hymenobacter setariae]|uniref:GAF domain-containing protein n=1 Tax=Hymenobacter setariae TaxID=2594794 RepID=A0A558C1S1_9BACT|nr:GAF domain-containing protein [Hymenobacter setariae]TVT42761.1 GAF domain-containing protein [Hymenobacter setariae]
MSIATLVPPNDHERLAALAPYRVLGTAPDAVFDEVVRLTAKLFSVPIALVSLVDEGSVWFKANFGLGGAERIARDESICSVAILNEDTTIYNDLQTAPCQLTKPGVAEALQLRFYAGHPLRDEQGHNIGALCIIDRKPRQLDITEQTRLQDLAQIVTQMLKLRLALHQRPQHASATWVKLYERLDLSLTRLDTLAELARWEDSPTTPAALQYQQSREEEINLVTQVLRQQVAEALALAT